MSRGQNAQPCTRDFEEIAYSAWKRNEDDCAIKNAVQIVAKRELAGEPAVTTLMDSIAAMMTEMEATKAEHNNG